MFYFGVDYYPEQWPEECWEVDARLMQEANINLVRLAEFAWSMMEPVEGKFDFEWLDHVVAILASNDIKVVLGTPTASPPAWLMAKDKSLFRVDENGRRLTYGNRREYCPNNPLYHKHSKEIVSQMAQHYQGHPTVIGWQIDNEFGDRCYCDTCRRAFQAWLLERYGYIEALNERWGTTFWSHTYSNWTEIPVPLKTGGPPNPGLALDFYRFASDSYVSYQELQLETIRETCPNHFVTHNLMGFQYPYLNYFDLSCDLDFVSWDVYCRTQWNIETEMDPSWFALGHDTMRGMKASNFWVMEQQSGAAGWDLIGVSPQPGELRKWAYQSIAHGADAIIFFRWRTARFGTEQYWHGILDHHGRPGRRYKEIQQMGDEIRRVGQFIHGSKINSQIAFLLSYDSRFSFEIQGNNPGFEYSTHFHSLYRAFYNKHISIDIVSPTSDLSSYKIVIAPALHIVSEEITKNLENYVREGGVLVITPRSGVKDLFNAVVDIPLPGLLADICGIEIKEYISLPKHSENEIKINWGEFPEATLKVGVWCDVLKTKGAKVLANYLQDFFSSEPAISLNKYGYGKAIYVGTMGQSRLNEMIARLLLEETGIEPYLRIPKGIEVSERWLEDRRIMILLNHTEIDQKIIIDGNFVDLLHDSLPIEETLIIPPQDVVILQEE